MKFSLGVVVSCPDDDDADGHRTSGQIESEESEFSLIKAILNCGWRCWWSMRFSEEVKFLFPKYAGNYRKMK